MFDKFKANKQITLRDFWHNIVDAIENIKTGWKDFKEVFDLSVFQTYLMDDSSFLETIDNGFAEIVSREQQVERRSY